MRALIYTAPNQIEFRGDDPPPLPPSPADAAIEVEACGICGSDLHAFLGHDDRRPPPLILGHEACGIAQSGKYKGRRVAVNPLATCGECEFCIAGRQNLCPHRQILSIPPRSGAFAELIYAPEKNLFLAEKIPPSIAALTEPSATALHAVYLAEKNLMRPILESHILVVGAGAIGLFAALLLRAKGCRALQIAETNPLRKKAAHELENFAMFNSAEESDGEFDLIIDAVGAKATRELSFQLIKPGGVVVHIGLAESGGGVDSRRMTLQEITLIGSYTYTPTDFAAALDSLARGIFGELKWVESRPLEEGAKSFAALAAGKERAGKIVLMI